MSGRVVSWVERFGRGDWPNNGRDCLARGIDCSDSLDQDPYR